MRIPGREGATLIGTAQEIWRHRQEATAAALAVFLLIAPVGYVSSLLIVLVETRRARAPHWVAGVLRATQVLRPWSMLDVAMLAIVVALTKLMEMTTVFAGVGIYATGAFVGLLAMTRVTFDRREAWNRIEWASSRELPTVSGGSPSAGDPSRATFVSAAHSGLVSCTACHLLSRSVTPVEPGHCPRCGAALEARRSGSIQKTWALIIAAAVCYVPANVLPMLESHALGSSESVSVIGGIEYLHNTGSWLLALVVLIASVMIPIAKLLALAYLLVTAQASSARNQRERIRLYRFVDVIGRWSMLDVFVDSFMAAVAQLPPFLWIDPGPGLAFFLSVVVLTMLAARSFDTRLIWDTGFAHG